MTMKTIPANLLLSFLFLAPLAGLALPDGVHYQGRLVDAAGDPVSGNVEMEIRLYDTLSGGGFPLYAEVIGPVSVNEGVYAFTFGSNGEEARERGEILAITENSITYYKSTLTGKPAANSLFVSDGLYFWTETAGSSNPNAFHVSVDTASGVSVAVTYLKGHAPDTGRTLIAEYRENVSATLSEVLRSAGPLYLALLVDGVEADTRTRLLAVPYALKSADAAALRAELRANNLIPSASFVFVEGGTLPAGDLAGTDVSNFYMSKHEVTWGQWKEVRSYADANGYDISFSGGGCADNHPVCRVKWYAVVKWCNAKSEQQGLTPVYTVSGATYRTGRPIHTTIEQNLAANGYRLPLEAEWEFAARGGNQTNGYTYAGGTVLDAVGWYLYNSDGAACDLDAGHGTWPVGYKGANELGLYDMSGNVTEWCWDQHFTSRRVRGGSFALEASFCTVSARGYSHPATELYGLGFRLARSVAP